MIADDFKTILHNAILNGANDSVIEDQKYVLGKIMEYAPLEPAS